MCIVCVCCVFRLCCVVCSVCSVCCLRVWPTEFLAETHNVASCVQCGLYAFRFLSMSIVCVLLCIQLVVCCLFLCIQCIYCEVGIRSY